MEDDVPRARNDDDDVARLLCGTPELPPHCVALTFDDGPGPRSAELARLLRDEGVPGTFFVLGESVERYGDVLDTYRDCGHGIALLHDFAAATEYTPAGLTEADLDLRIIEITALLIERLRGAGLSFAGLPEPTQARTPGPPARSPGEPAADGPAAATRTRAAGGLPEAAEALQSLRLHRATARAAGGILDLLMPIRAGDGPPLFCAPPVV